MRWSRALGFLSFRSWDGLGSSTCAEAHENACSASLHVYKYDFAMRYARGGLQLPKLVRTAAA
jgi:hypothetical protein